MAKNESEGTVELTDKHRAELKALLKFWNDIQGKLKRAEQISQLAVIPAINELRYAGRMLISSLAKLPEDEANGIPNIESALVSARQYLKNADHDISDSLIYYFQGRVDDLNARFGAKAVVSRVPEYNEMLAKLQESRQLIIDSRSDLGKRDENYAKLGEIVEFIIEKYFVLDKSDVFMALEIDAKDREISKFQKIAMAATVAAVILPLSAFFLF